jgi:hypothetical protein
MFRQLALLLTPPPAPPPPDVALQATNDVFGIHPIQISRFLEEVWEARNPNLRILTPTDLEIPPTVAQVALERDSGIRDRILQWVTISGTATGGTFSLAFTRAGAPTLTTAPIAFNATAAAVQGALVTAGIPAGDVVAAGGPLPGQPVSLKFTSALGSRAITLEVVNSALTPTTPPPPPVARIVGLYPPRIWDHLIYAYMVENTRAYEIFRRVLEEYAYGERLGVPSDEGQRWLRTTEQLFYRDNPPFQIYSLASWIRPDIRAVRRNAYQRLFGMDLNHGTDDNRPYPYPRAAAANTEFSATFEELLREVWRAIENVRNQVGANQTDVTTIANLARAIFDMLRVRRQERVGNLARDELYHVSTMDWLHLTLSFNTPIVHDLKADASSAAERLQKIGERVGLPAHSRSDSYFRLATNMSLILRELELGTFNDPGGAPALFQTGVFQAAMQETIAHWSIATGRDVKVRPVTMAAPQPMPIRPTPRPFLATPSSGNGRVTASREAIASQEALERAT